MRIRMTHVGGPLDGTIEFEEDSKWPQDSTEEYMLSRGTYELTKGVVGKGAQAAAPAVNESIRTGEILREDMKHVTIHEYYITKREETADTLIVTAEHRPKHRPRPDDTTAPPTS